MAWVISPMGGILGTWCVISKCHLVRNIQVFGCLDTWWVISSCAIRPYVTWTKVYKVGKIFSSSLYLRKLALSKWTLQPIPALHVEIVFSLLGVICQYIQSIDPTCWLHVLCAESEDWKVRRDRESTLDKPGALMDSSCFYVSAVIWASLMLSKFVINSYSGFSV